MYAFQYERAADAKAAVDMLKADGEARFLGGGQSLLASMKLRLASPSTLIDVTRIPGMSAIRMEGDELVIGAAARHADVASNPEVMRRIPALAVLANGIGDRQVRAMGTLGGSLANDDPAADYPAAVLALNAIIVTDRRNIAADNFFKGLFETALSPDELITAVRFPQPDQAAYVKFRNPASRFALVGVMVARTGKTVRVAVTGAADKVFRAPALEQALCAAFTPAAARAVRMDPSGLGADLHASAEYRAHLIPVLASRAVEQALKG
ncbi:FAD binding domain-containing protein [Cupriavidus pampae]|uniref:FAD-binding PCMH-type domain-containing protein n=1 Tax=Cupriavidus pampae TaxID=659251 RepID=A0ABM8WRI0_9BURK|nr:xanthine dehydrogenase family protein subunit M [Cupriavidus pampae]CAG9170076.1 hypothetical protein LMG32289_01993 [Cupriavidus pampae]